MLLNKGSQTLRVGAGPSLPKAVLSAFDGLQVRLGAGACGSAVATGQPVIIADSENHPYTVAFRDLARAHELLACWSFPLRAAGEVVGAFAAYHRTRFAATPADLALVENSANLAALALEQYSSRRARDEAESHFRTAASLLPGYLFVTDPDGKRLYANAYFEKLTGLTTPQLAAQGWHSILHPDDVAQAEANWRSALKMGMGYEVRMRIRTADGSYRWHMGRVRPNHDADGAINGWVGVTIDIDELVAGREMLQRYRSDLEALVADRTQALAETAAELQAEMTRRERAMEALAHSQKMEALGQLTGGVAHDFNNMLAAIMGGLQLIERRANDPELLQLARNGLHASERAASLVRQLLAVARSDPPTPSRIDPAALLPLLRPLISHALHGGIDLRIEAAPESWPVLVDPTQLETALLNLALNARDAMPNGGTLRISAENLPPGAPLPSALGARACVVIRVSDTGLGIAPAALKRVFEPFFTTKERGAGTGLGLAMVRGFAHQAGGDIELRSTLGVGTEAAIYLPRAEVDGPAIAPQPTQTIVAGSGATVLVVDDDDAVRTIASAFLRDAGYRVLEASGGAVALSLLESTSNVDLVLTDLAMPGMDGVQLAARIRARNPCPPVVFMTGYADNYDLTRELTLQKPYSARAMLDAVGRGLNRQAADVGQADILPGIQAPLLRDAYQTWQSLRGAASMPRFGQLTVASRPWTDHCFVVAVDHATAPPGFHAVSKGAAWADDLPPGFMTAPDAYQACVAAARPLHHIQANGPGVIIERLLLPATAAPGGVTHVLGLVAVHRGDQD
jgi:PAS domain S-box-containing protein